MKSIAKQRSHFSTSLRCGVCHSDINSTEHIYQSNILYIPVCARCKVRFPQEDIEMMLNMFLAYGGYFGKFKSEVFSLQEALQSVSISNTEGHLLEKVNISLLYQAILHGITPREFILQLEELTI